MSSSWGNGNGTKGLKTVGGRVKRRDVDFERNYGEKGGGSVRKKRMTKPRGE